MERGDYAFFNQTYASNKIGCAKPDPHFFELILEAEETEAQNVFFTDDKEENVAAAASLVGGCAGILVVCHRWACLDYLTISCCAMATPFRFSIGRIGCSERCS